MDPLLHVYVKYIKNAVCTHLSPKKILFVDKLRTHIVHTMSFIFIKNRIINNIILVLVHSQTIYQFPYWFQLTGL